MAIPTVTEILACKNTDSLAKMAEQVGKYPDDYMCECLYKLILTKLDAMTCMTVNEFNSRFVEVTCRIVAGPVLANIKRIVNAEILKINTNDKAKAPFKLP